MSTYNSNMPRERYKLYGNKQLSDYELLAIVINTGSHQKNVLELSREVIEKFGSLHNTINAEFHELKKIKGIGDVKATKIKILKEMIIRYNNNVELNEIKVHSPKMVFNYFKNILMEEKQEKLLVVAIDTKGKIISYKNIYIGTINEIKVHSREIFNYAIKTMAYQIILIHNHPTGDSTPSPEDVAVTKDLQKISKILDILIIDHIIIGYNQYSSIREKHPHIFFN